jgi:hypothetical protein
MGAPVDVLILAMACPFGLMGSHRTRRQAVEFLIGIVLGTRADLASVRVSSPGPSCPSGGSGRFTQCALSPNFPRQDTEYVSALPFGRGAEDVWYV